MSNDPIHVKPDICVSCGVCVQTCPFGAIAMDDGPAVIDLQKCTLCGACVDACGFEAIEMAVKPVSATDVSGYQDVWVVVEHDRGRIEPVTFELLGEGRKLADALGMKLCAVLLGHETGALTTELVERGADTVYVVDRPELAYFQDEPYANVLIEIVRHRKPNIVLCGATTVGRSVISRVAVRVGAGLTADCTGLAIDPETKDLLQTRPAFGGNIMATIIDPGVRPQMSTVRPKVMKEAPRTPGRTGTVIAEQVSSESLVSRTRRLKFVPDTGSTVNLSDASIIVSGGRGIQHPDNFGILKEFAGVLGAAIGATRAAVDANWIAYSHQVGQTGKTVCPKIYFACGVSGQIQHIVGMSSSDIIVAINRDADAPIFKIATYGIVGDALKIIPMMTGSLQKLLNK